MKNCNDKESCSLVLLMTILNKNGVCAGVLKEGVFFDKKYGSIRKCLIENFNVKYVISVPQDQFENTSTKTSIVVFENTNEKTKEIIFYNLIVQTEQDDIFEEIGDEIQLVKSKGDIIDVTDREICRCDVDDITDDYSLNYKNYLKNDIKVNKDFKLVKLADKMKILLNTKHNKSMGQTNGKYRFYSSSQNTLLYTDTYEIENLSLIIGNGGKFNIHVDKKFTPSKHVSVLQFNNEFDTWYTYYYLKIIHLLWKVNMMDLPLVG